MKKAYNYASPFPAKKQQHRNKKRRSGTYIRISFSGDLFYFFLTKQVIQATA